MIRRLATFFALALGLFVPTALFAATGTIDASNYQSRQCASEDCGTYSTVYWRTDHGAPVTVTDSAITGEIWSSALGWIILGPLTNGGVHNTTGGVLSGYAWSTTAGWINFLPTHAGVTINTSTGEFSGYAWTSGAGWMRFDCALGSTACVKTDWRPTAGTTTTGTSSGGTNGRGVTMGGTTTTTGDTGTTGTASGGTSTTGDGTTTGTTTSGTTTTTTGGESTGGTTTGTTSGTTTGGTTGVGTSGSGTTGTSGGGIVQPPVPPVSSSSGCVPSPEDGLVFGQIKSSYCDTKEKVLTTFNKVKDIMTSEQGGLVATTVATVGVLAGATLTIASGLFLNPLSFSEILLIPARLWSLLLAALGLKKRRRPWGTVYDSVTKQPLDPVYVTLKNMEGAEVTSSITDLDGRFGFVVPEPGSYAIFVHKTNYLFPSQKLVGQDHDELYRDLYFGEYFRVENAGDAVYKNIPMDAEHFDWNENAKREQSLMKFYSKRDKILRRLSDIFFGVGFAVATLAAVLAPKPYNLIIFALYILLFFVRRSGAHSRPFGDITDAAGVPLAYALIRIKSASTDVEVMHRIADARGRYYALLPNGEYRVRIDKKLPDGTYQTVAEAIPVSVAKGFMAKKFSV
jgi:hypothetical protein